MPGYSQPGKAQGTGQRERGMQANFVVGPPAILPVAPIFPPLDANLGILANLGSDMTFLNSILVYCACGVRGLHEEFHNRLSLSVYSSWCLPMFSCTHQKLLGDVVEM